LFSTVSLEVRSLEKRKSSFKPAFYLHHHGRGGVPPRTRPAWRAAPRLPGTPGPNVANKNTIPLSAVQKSVPLPSSGGWEWRTVGRKNLWHSALGSGAFFGSWDGYFGPREPRGRLWRVGKVRDLARELRGVKPKPILTRQPRAVGNVGPPQEHQRAPSGLLSCSPRFLIRLLLLRDRTLENRLRRVCPEVRP